MHAAFAGLLPKHHSADLPKDDAAATPLKKLLERNTIAAIIIEPLVQGAGGMNFHDARRASKAARSRRQTQCVADFRRNLHRLWPYRDTCLPASKPVSCLTSSRCRKHSPAARLPMAATIATRKVFDAFWSDDPKKALMHGPTYMANALACAAANASLDLFEHEPRLRRLPTLPARWSAALRHAADCRA